MSGLYWTKRRIIDAIRDHALHNHGRPPTSSDWRKGTPDHPAAQTVRERFGTWSFAVQLAGFPRPTSGGRPYWNRRRCVVAIQAWAHKHGRPPKWTDWLEATPEHPHAQTVRDNCGGWRSAIAAAGFEPRTGHGHPRTGVRTLRRAA